VSLIPLILFCFDWGILHLNCHIQIPILVGFTYSVFHVSILRFSLIFCRLGRFFQWFKKLCLCWTRHPTRCVSG